MSLGRIGSGETVQILGKQQFPTPRGHEQALQQLGDALEALLNARLSGTGGHRDQLRRSAGQQAGRILSPPNLPGWDDVDAVTPFRERFGVPTALQNDANADALAEWQWGAGQGCRNMVFLTFGTGMGAGLILNGEL